MKRKTRTSILYFIKNNIIIISLIIILVVAVLGFRFLCCRPQIISGLFILLSAVITAQFAIHKYQKEQRTMRLQKLYFEDALLGQAQSSEKMMSQTNKNMLLTENLYNLTAHILKKVDVEIEIIKKELISVFDNTLTNLGLDIFTTDFKKETISKLLYDSGIKQNVLPTWIKKFEEDTYRFFAFLQSQILIFKIQTNRLTESNKESYLKSIHEIFSEYVPQNYLLINRHYILFNLLSEIVIEFSSENYASFKEIAEAFQKKKILKIVELLNTSFQDVIDNFKSIDISTIEKEDAIKLAERIKCAQEKIKITLYDN